MSELEKRLIQMENNHIDFQAKLQSIPLTPHPCFVNHGVLLPPQFTPDRNPVAIPDEIASQFSNLSPTIHRHCLYPSSAHELHQAPKRIAMVFSGGPAPGGHNVIAGILDMLGPHHTAFGVLGGPGGLLSGRLQQITCEDIRPYRNTGGFHFLGTDRTKIKSTSQIKAVKDVVTQYQLDGLIIIGGDDSNTNATVLAHHLSELNCTVVGVPKTIDGDMQLNSLLPITFGFDTATTFYSHLVGNLMTDSKSVKKYWHFVKLMGRDTSHVALEVALQTHPTLTLLTEEMIHRHASLEMIVDDIIDVIKRRSENGLNHGVVIIPEGLIAHISNDISRFILNYDPTALTQQQDDHGHHPVSAIQTEVLLGRCIELKLSETNINFQPRYHAFGYEGRCSPPSPFDSWYGYQLGLTAASLFLGGHTGFLASLTQLSTGGMPLGIPLMRLFDYQSDPQSSSAVQSAVIKRVPVNLDSPAFRFFNSRRDQWANSDCFSSPGPLVIDDDYKTLPRSVALNQGYTDFVITP